MKRTFRDVARVDDMAKEHMELAQRRTAAILRNWHLMDHHPVRLVVSCYLQGVRDMAELFIQRPELVRSLMAEPTDYQI